MEEVPKQFIYASNPTEAANIFASRYVNRFPKSVVEVESFKVKVTAEKNKQYPWMPNVYIFNVRPIIKAEFVTTLDREMNES